MRLLGRSLLILAGLLFATGALAQPIVDQEQVVLDTGTTLALGGSSEQKLAQVFTAGLTGYLSHVTLPIGCTPGSIVTVKIEKTIGGAPSGTVLASETLPGTALPGPVGGFRIIEFCEPAAVIAGEEYALTLEHVLSATTSCGVAHGLPGDTYSGGLAYFDARPNPPGWIAMIPEFDLGFQTYVDQNKKGCCKKRK